MQDQAVASMDKKLGITGQLLSQAGIKLRDRFPPALRVGIQ